MRGKRKKPSERHLKQDAKMMNITQGYGIIESYKRRLKTLPKKTNPIKEHPKLKISKLKRPPRQQMKPAKAYQSESYYKIIREIIN